MTIVAINPPVISLGLSQLNQMALDFQMDCHICKKIQPTKQPQLLTRQTPRIFSFCSFEPPVLFYIWLIDSEVDQMSLNNF